MKRITIEFSGMYEPRDNTESLVLALCQEWHPGRPVYGINQQYGNGMSNLTWQNAYLKDFPQTSFAATAHNCIYFANVNSAVPAANLDYMIFHRFNALLVGGNREWKDYTEPDVVLLSEMVTDAVINEEKSEEILKFFDGYVALFDNRDLDHACFCTENSGRDLTEDALARLKQIQKFAVVSNDLERY